MTIRSRALMATTATVAALTVTLTGCTGNDAKDGGASATATAASAQDATALLTQAADAAAQTTSAHFLVETTGKIPNLPITKVEGGLNVKPAVSATGTATVDFGGTAEGKFVYLDGTMYSDIMTGRFVDYGDGSSIFPVNLLFDAKQGIPHVLTKILTPAVAGTETIGGEQTSRITGKVRTEEVSALTGSRLVNPETKDVPMPVTAWVRTAGDHQLVRLRLTPAEGATLTLTFSDWGKRVDVTKPQVSTPPADDPNPGEGRGIDAK